MKKIISLTLALVIIAACLSGLCFAADPIARIETNGRTTEIKSLEMLAAAINADGTTTVPDVEVPKTGASVVALGVMALVSLAGAVISKKH